MSEEKARKVTNNKNNELSLNLMQKRVILKTKVVDSEKSLSFTRTEAFCAQCRRSMVLSAFKVVEDTGFV